MAQKFGGALGAFMLMQVLALSGYSKDVIVQSNTTLEAIKALMSYIPAIGALLGAACLTLYPLTTSTMKSIQSQLEKKRGQKA